MRVEKFLYNFELLDHDSCCCHYCLLVKCKFDRREKSNGRYKQQQQKYK